MAGNPKIVVQTPRGEIVQVKTKSGNVTAKLTWSPNTGAKWTGQFTRAQKFLDSEVLRNSSPFVPLRTGTLMRSGQLGTVIGSGEVIWNAPYAAAQYYNTAETRSYDVQRGAKWFERAKASFKSTWIAGVKKIAGGGA